MSFLSDLLNKFQAGDVSKEDALKKIQSLYGYSDIGVAKIDDCREERTGMPEFIFGEAKNKEMLHRVVSHYIKSKKNCLITRLDEEKIQFLKNSFPEIHFSKKAKLAWVRFNIKPQNTTPIGVITAGTSDLPIALESILTLRFLGYHPSLVSDIGVSAIHRLLLKKESLEKFKIIICVAGMEAALLTVLGGLTGKPIIGVPTSTGYGVSTGGFSTLLSMLSSCSPNVSCVNIDNGFGAACFCHSLVHSMNN